MPHSPNCQCPPCRYRRGEGKGQAPRLSIRIDPEIRDIIHNHPEGPRAYLEGLVRAEPNLNSGLAMEKLRNSQNREAIRTLEEKLRQAEAKSQIYQDALNAIMNIPGPAATVAKVALLLQ